MKTLRESIYRIFTNQKTVGISLIAIGLVVVIFFGLRTVRSFKKLQYIQEQGLDRGTATVSAIRPWMTVRYVNVAFGVPEEYMFAELKIPFNRRNSDITLKEMNQAYELGQSDRGIYPAILDKVIAAITTYKLNPVTTGLEDIRPWMTLHYIANSTGITEVYLLEQLEIGAGDKNIFMPLGELADTVHYEGGPHRMVNVLKTALQQYAEEK
jgi:hypothetical protein